MYIPLLRENLQKLQCFDVPYLNSKENVIFVASNPKEILMEFQQALKKMTTAAGCFSRNETLLRTNSKECSPSLLSFYVWCVLIFSVFLTISEWFEWFPPKIFKNTIRQKFNSNSSSQITCFIDLNISYLTPKGCLPLLYNNNKKTQNIHYWKNYA